MACLTAIARAMKSAMGGGMDFLRANAFIGLLLGNLPLVSSPDAAYRLVEVVSRSRSWLAAASIACWSRPRRRW